MHPNLKNKEEKERERIRERKGRKEKRREEGIGEGGKGGRNHLLDLWAGKVTRWLRTLSALAEDQSSDPSTHIRLLTNNCNSSPGDVIPLWASAQSYTRVHIPTYRNTHTLYTYVIF